MEIVSIFAADNLEEKGGLFAVRYKKNEPDEYERLFDLWNDQEWIYWYLKKNRSYLNNNYFKGLSTDDIQESIIDEAGFLEDYFIRLAKHDFRHYPDTLQQLFKPLDNREHQLYERQRQKAQATGLRFKKQFLRLYAIRLHSNLFIITGGAIKFTHRMEDHEDTKYELVKIDLVRNFLQKNNISTADDLTYYYDNIE